MLIKEKTACLCQRGLFTNKIQPVSLFTETGFFIVLKTELDI